MNKDYPASTFVNSFSDYDRWPDIAKQSIFEAWVPFVSDRPLDFFIPKEKDSNEGYITNVIDDCTPLSEHMVVNTLKRRKVVILTSDELCQSKTFSDVLIAKIISIKEEHRTQNWYRTLLADQHSLFVHLPDHITGVESYVNLAQVTTIGKKLLIEKKGYLTEDRMMLVEQRHEECVDLGIIKSDHEIASSQ